MAARDESVADLIAKEVRFTSFTTYKYRGNEAVLPDRFLQFQERPDEWEKRASAFLGRVIYNVYHLRKDWSENTLDDQRQMPISTVEGMADSFLCSLYRYANTGLGWWSRGWLIVESSESGYYVSNGEVKLLVDRAGIEGASTIAYANGDEVSVRFPNNLPFVSPGFYVAISDYGPPREKLYATARLYINTTIDGAAIVLARLIEFASSNGLPATIKVVNNLVHMSRSDTVVAFFEREGVAKNIDELKQCLSDCSSYLVDKHSIFIHCCPVKG